MNKKNENREKWNICARDHTADKGRNEHLKPTCLALEFVPLSTITFHCKAKLQLSELSVYCSQLEEIQAQATPTFQSPHFLPFYFKISNIDTNIKPHE